MRRLIPTRRAVLLAAVVLTLSPAAARATFAGTNGRIAFEAVNGGSGAGALFTVTPEGRGLRRLGARPGARPAWTSDGSTLAFVVPSERALFASGPDGRHERELLHTSVGAYPDDPAWSPDGRRLAFVELTGDRSSGSTNRLVVEDRMTGSQSAIPVGVNAAGPAWSPDGRWLAYLDEFSSPREHGRCDLWRSRPDGTG